MIWVIVFLNFAARLDRFHLNPAQKVAPGGRFLPTLIDSIQARSDVNMFAFFRQSPELTFYELSQTFL
jgi:hypothetical protein